MSKTISVICKYFFFTKRTSLVISSFLLGNTAKAKWAAFLAKVRNPAMPHQDPKHNQQYQQLTALHWSHGSFLPSFFLFFCFVLFCFYYIEQQCTTLMGVKGQLVGVGSVPPACGSLPRTQVHIKMSPLPFLSFSAMGKWPESSHVLFDFWDKKPTDSNRFLWYPRLQRYTAIETNSARHFHQMGNSKSYCFLDNFL